LTHPIPSTRYTGWQAPGLNQYHVVKEAQQSRMSPSRKVPSKQQPKKNRNNSENKNNNKRQRPQEKARRQKMQTRNHHPRIDQITNAGAVTSLDT
jgi:sRNA-binding protein